jgi:hypothetical protein
MVTIKKLMLTISIISLPLSPARAQTVPAANPAFVQPGTSAAAMSRGSQTGFGQAGTSAAAMNRGFQTGGSTLFNRLYGSSSVTQPGFPANAQIGTPNGMNTTGVYNANQATSFPAPNRVYDSLLSTAPSTPALSQAGMLASPAPGSSLVAPTFAQTGTSAAGMNNALQINGGAPLSPLQATPNAVQAVNPAGVQFGTAATMAQTATGVNPGLAQAGVAMNGVSTPASPQTASFAGSNRLYEGLLAAVPTGVRSLQVNAGNATQPMATTPNPGPAQPGTSATILNGAIQPAGNAANNGPGNLNITQPGSLPTGALSGTNTAFPTSTQVGANANGASNLTTGTPIPNRLYDGLRSAMR